jgi:hypothetical protein
MVTNDTAQMPPLTAVTPRPSPPNAVKTSPPPATANAATAMLVSGMRTKDMYLMMGAIGDFSFIGILLSLLGRLVLPATLSLLKSKSCATPVFSLLG